MKNTELMEYLGNTAEEKMSRDLLADFGIKSAPKIKPGDDVTSIVMNKKMGVEITFRDEAFIDKAPRKYAKRTLVLWNIRLYGPGNKPFSEYRGTLPLDLSFGISPEEAIKALGKKPVWKNDDGTRLRFDFPHYCAFLVFDKSGKLDKMSIQMPIR